jgi:orotate phosphoribosyltransferase
MNSREQIRQAILSDGIIRGQVILSSGAESDFYLDLRRISLSGKYALALGEMMLELTNEFEYDMTGGLTLGADPVAASMMYVAAQKGKRLDSFVVRKAEKTHGLQKRIEGPDVKGRRILVVEDTSTTGESVLSAVQAVSEAGAIVVGVAVIVDRGAKEKVVAAGLKYTSAFCLSDLGI